MHLALTASISRVVPTGLGRACYHYPGLTPWAIEIPPLSRLSHLGFSISVFLMAEG